MPVYPSYDFIDVLALEGEPRARRASTPHERSRRRPRRPPQRRQVRAVQPHRRRRQAIVTEEAGTTRDRHFARAEWNGPRVLARRHRRPVRRPAARRWTSRSAGRSRQAIDEADLLLFVVDAKVGRASERRARRRDAARRRASRGCSSRTRSTTRSSTDFYEFYQLGAGDPIPGVGAERQELGRPARRDRRAAARGARRGRGGAARRRRRPAERRQVVVREPAARRGAARRQPRSPARRATRSTRR